MYVSRQNDCASPNVKTPLGVEVWVPMSFGPFSVAPPGPAPESDLPPQGPSPYRWSITPVWALPLGLPVTHPGMQGLSLDPSLMQPVVWGSTLWIPHSSPVWAPPLYICPDSPLDPSLSSGVAPPLDLPLTLPLKPSLSSSVALHMDLPLTLHQCGPSPGSAPDPPPALGPSPGSAPDPPPALGPSPPEPAELASQPSESTESSTYHTVVGFKAPERQTLCLPARVCASTGSRVGAGVGPLDSRSRVGRSSGFSHWAQGWAGGWSLQQIQEQTKRYEDEITSFHYHAVSRESFVRFWIVMSHVPDMVKVTCCRSKQAA